MMKKKFRFLSVLLLVLFSLVGFGYCDLVSYFTRGSFSINTNSSTNFSFDVGTCIITNNYSSTLSFYDNNGTLVSTGLNGSNGLVCLDFAGYITSSSTSSHTFYYYTGLDSLWGSSSCPTCPECQQCPEINTGDILSGYIAISDVNDSYCISNGLCGEVSTGLSQLFINDIRHESMPFINITIPEEFNRNYNYTGNGTQFDLNVLGYNTDSDYIAGIINTQKSTPNKTDLNNVITGIIPLLIPGLVIILFIYFVFKFLKKIF